MKRILIIVGAVVALGAAGVTGLWFANQSTARDQMVAVLEDIRASGIDLAYAGPEIQGFPFAYEGVVTDLVATDAGSGVAITMDRLTAKVGVADLNSVVFSLPTKATITEIDPAGAALGRPADIAIEDGVLTVTDAGDAAGAQRFDFDFVAAALRLQPGGATADRAEVAFVAPTLKGSAGPDAFDLRYRADRLETRFEGVGPDGQPQNGRLTSTGLSSDIAGSREAVSFDTRYDSVELAVEGLAALTATDLAFTLKTTPKAGGALAIDGVLQGRSGETAVGEALRAMVVAVVEGGAFDAGFTAAALSVDVTPPESEPGATLRFSGEDMRYAAEVKPETLSLSFTGDALVYDLQVPSGAGVAPGAAGAPGAMSYDVGGFEFEARADAAEGGDGFDLRPVLNAENEEVAAEAFLLAVRDQIVAGGQARLGGRAERAETVLSLQDQSTPFTSLSSKAGLQDTRLLVTANQASLKSSAEDVSYEVAGGLAGAVQMERFVLDVAGPLSRSDETQTLTALFDMDTITVDDALWALFDPQNVLSRDIRGVKIDLATDVTVFENVLTLTEDQMLQGPPMAFQTVGLNQVLIDALGARAEATGSVNVAAAPPTADVTVVLSDWRSLFENIRKTPFGGAPDVAGTLLFAEGFLQQYGQDGAETGSTVLEVAYDGFGATINGQPFPAEPAPTPEIEETPLDETPLEPAPQQEAPAADDAGPAAEPAPQ